MKTAQEMLRHGSPGELTEDELEMVRDAARCIGEALDRSRAASITLVSDESGQPPVELPTRALRLISDVLRALSERKAVTVVAAKRELTTVEAAHYLGVSRPFLIREIEAGRLQHRMVGTHRRVAFEDLLAYQQQMAAKQKSALKELSEEATRLRLEY